MHGITFSTCYVCLAYLSGLQEGLGLKLLQIQGHHDEVICTNVHQLLSLMTLYIEEINDDLCAEKICDEEPTTASNRTESFTSRRRPFSMLRYLLSSWKELKSPMGNKQIERGFMYFQQRVLYVLIRVLMHASCPTTHFLKDLCFMIWWSRFYIMFFWTVFQKLCAIKVRKFSQKYSKLFVAFSLGKGYFFERAKEKRHYGKTWAGDIQCYKYFVKKRRK